MRQMFCALAFIFCTAHAAVPLQDTPLPSGGRQSEFLKRWDRRYRLIDPELESSANVPERDYATAAAELKKAIITGIPDEEMYYRLGFCYEKLGDYGRALEAYENSSVYLAGRNEGRRTMDDGRLTREIKAGTSGKESLHYLLCYRTGLVNAKRGEYKEAARQFEMALEFNRDSAAAHNNLGYCYRSLYMKRRAVEEFKGALSLNTHLAEAFLNMGITQAELGRLDEAESSLRRALDNKPQIRGARFSLALVLIARGRASKALEQLRITVDDFPGDARAHLALATICLQTGLGEDARREAQLAFSLMPDLKQESPEIEAILGEKEKKYLPDDSAEMMVNERELLDKAGRLMEAGRLDEAKDVYSRITEYNTRSVPAYTGLARVSEFKGGVRFGKGFPAAKSVAFYQKALSIQPENSNTWLGLGNVYERSGMFSKAAGAFTRAKELSPGLTLASYNLGICYGRLGETEAAERHFREVVEVDPGFSDAYFQLGVLYAEKRDFEKAIGAYKRAVELNPSDADAHLNLGQIYRVHAENRSGALDHFNAYLRLAPGERDAPRIRKWCEDLRERQ